MHTYARLAPKISPSRNRLSLQAKKAQEAELAALFNEALTAGAKRVCTFVKIQRIYAELVSE